jgi:hypothetical protein
MFGKIAYGVPGDVISHIGRTVAVNGHPVAQMKPFTRFGEPLTPGATGRVPAGCYFAATPHKDGFDSRYGEIGFVCGRQIIGTGSRSYEDACPSCVCAVAALGAALVFPPMRSEAKDYGQAAQAFPVIEPDLLSTIEARLRRAEASGELARTNAMFAKRVEAKVRRPDPVAGITAARAAAGTSILRS